MYNNLNTVLHISCELSLLVTTFNRHEILHKNLEQLLLQLPCLSTTWEILVLIDKADTMTQVLELPQHSDLKFLRPAQSGVVASRNLGIEQARGRIIVFLQDDIFPNELCLKNHLDFHRKYPNENFVFQGAVFYPTEIRNEFMDFLEHGWQNSFLGKETGFSDQPCWEAANSSIKKVFFTKNKISFNINYIVFENLDVEIQMKNFNAKIYFDARSTAYHFHVIGSPLEYKKRIENIAEFEFDLSRGRIENLSLRSYVDKPPNRLSLFFLVIIHQIFLYVLRNINSKKTRFFCWGMELQLMKYQKFNELMSSEK